MTVPGRVPQEQARERAAGPAARAPAGLLHPLRVLQRRLGNAYVARALTEGGPLEPEIAGAIESERGRGRPLDPARRESFEHAFGAQFGDVRLHDDETAAEMRELPAMLRFTTDGIEDMVRTYVGRLSDLPPDALPGAAPLAGLPRTAILLAEYDDLRASGDLLARQLAEVDVRVRTYRAAGMLHGHLNRSASLKEVDRSLDFFADSLREG